MRLRFRPLPACLASVALCSCVAAPPPTPVRQAGASNASCASELHETRKLRDEGRLDRALRRVERAWPSCTPIEQRSGRALRLELLLALGRTDDARTLAALVAKDRYATEEERRAASALPAPVSAADRARPLAPLGQADVALAVGDADRALGLYEAAWREQPWHAQALVGAGLAARMLSKERLAREHFDRALAAFESLTGKPAHAVRLINELGEPPIAQARAENVFGNAVVLYRRAGRDWVPVRKLSAPPTFQVLHHGALRGFVEGGALRVLGPDGLERVALPGYTDFEVAADGRRIVAWSESKKSVVDLDSGKSFGEMPVGGPGSFVGSGEKWLIHTDGEHTVILDLPELVERLRIPGRQVEVSSTLSRAVGLRWERERGAIVDVWDLEKKERIGSHPLKVDPKVEYRSALDATGKRYVWVGREVGSVDLVSGKAAILGPAPQELEGWIWPAEDGERVCLGLHSIGFRILPGKPRPGYRAACYWPDASVEEGRLFIAELPVLTRGRESTGEQPRYAPGFGDAGYEVMSPRADVIARVEHSRAKMRYIVALYRLPSGKLVRELESTKSTEAPPPTLEFSPDGLQLVVRDWSGGAIGWDVQTGDSSAVPKQESRLESAPPEAKAAAHWYGRIRARGTSVVWSGSQGWSWWDLEKGRRIRGERGAEPELVLSPGGRRLGRVVWKTEPRGRSLTVLDSEGKSSPELVRLPSGSFLVSDAGRVAWSDEKGNWVADPSPEGWQARQLDSRGGASLISEDGKLIALGGEHRVVASTTSARVLWPSSTFSDWSAFGIDPEGRVWSKDLGLELVVKEGELELYGSHPNKPWARLFPTGPESAVLLFADGRVQRLGPPGPADGLACMFGDQQIAPFEVCEGRSLVDGALPGRQSP